ncbi:hypothetical protein A9Q96_00535 [Rhodobacterales bacterium 52_120_T64]|nr:hypothetical protein A9Q96_00535 [Rhodobacterales bacterium 52_120_T64]
MAQRDWFTITDGIRTYDDGTKEYYNEAGELHRTTGPAAEWYCGECRWFLNGERLSISEWCDRLGKSQKEKAILLLKYATSRSSTWILE